MFRNPKGVYGYLNKKRKLEAFVTLILFSIVLAIFGIGYIITHTRLNTMTVLAVVSTLPACKKAVDLIMVLRYKTFDKEIYDKCVEHQGSLVCAYDMIISSYEELMPLHAIAIAGNTIIGFTSSYKVDDKKLTNHLEEILSNNNCKKASVKIFSKLDAYLKRMDEMNTHLISDETPIRQVDEFGKPEPTKEEFMKNVILAISI